MTGAICTGCPDVLRCHAGGWTKPPSHTRPCTTAEHSAESDALLRALRYAQAQAVTERARDRAAAAKGRAERLEGAA